MDQNTIAMTLKPWCPVYYQDFQVLTSSRNYTQSLDHLPKLGFIAYQDDTPVAAGFLRMLEGGYAHLDSLVTNGELSSGVRHEALSMLVAALIEKAKELKLLGLIAHTGDDGILDRAADLGFKESPQTIISLSLV